MSATPWPEEFEKLLRTFLPLLDAERPLTGDLDLVDSGLDSLGTVTLLLELEQQFEVMIPDEFIDAAAFATPDDVWSLVVRARG